MDERVRVGILGCGHVGGALVRLIHDHADVIEARAGVPLEVARVAVAHLDKERDLPLPVRCFTDDAGAVVGDPDVDIVVEVIGGIEPARTLIVEALMGGKPVVTANKELIATHGRELFETAEGAGVDLLFEASVAGGVPLIRPLRESLAGDRIRRVMGIVNGTTNYILTAMTDAVASFADALAEAQRLGFAEADPTADVEGYDAAAKAAILASLAFHTTVTSADVYREGITSVTAADIASARNLGCVVKLLAICERCNGGISARVHPAMIPRLHPLAAVREAYNAVFGEAESAGSLMFYGAGAGGRPTASAVLGDIVAVARNRVAGIRGPEALPYAELPVLPIGDALTRYYVALDVDDRPGVLAPVAEAFARHNVSIKDVRQDGRGDDASLVIVTHTAREAELAATVSDLGAMPAVRAVDSVLRVEGEEEQ